MGRQTYREEKRKLNDRIQILYKKKNLLKYFVLSVQVNLRSKTYAELLLNMLCGDNGMSAFVGDLFPERRAAHFSYESWLLCSDI